MKTSIAIDKLINVTPVIGNVATLMKADEALLTMIKSSRTEGKTDNFTFGITVLPYILRNYATQCYEILGAFTDKTAEEVAEQDFVVTIKDLKALLVDTEIMSFFQ